MKEDEPSAFPDVFIIAHRHLDAVHLFASQADEHVLPVVAVVDAPVCLLCLCFDAITPG